MNFEIRSSCIPQVGPKCNGKCPYKRPKRKTYRREGNRSLRQRLNLVATSQGRQGLPTATGGRKRQGKLLPDTLILDFWPSELSENKFLLF